MKEKIGIFLIASAVSIPAFAVEEVPEPSSLALFAAGGLAVALLAKFKK
jgi:hypothetical protein